MRFIGSIPDSQLATRFSDYLIALGINNSVEQGSSGFAVWVHDDDHIERSKTELATFLSDPNRTEYAQASDAAQRVRDSQQQRDESLRKNYIDYRTSFAGIGSKPMPLTIVLVAICSIIALVTQAGTKPAPVYDWLRFGNLTTDEQVQELVEVVKDLGRPHSRTVQLLPPGAQQILHGQAWRLFTPMFMHFGIVHFIFNMMWLLDLGAMIERRRGTLMLLAIVLLTSLLSNVAQFYWNGPNFGGMSGVVYGLFGYVWVKSRIEPHLGLRLHQQTILIMMIWLIVCAVGIVPHVANAAHVIGLVVGVVLAHAPYSWRRMKRKQRAM